MSSVSSIVTLATLTSLVVNAPFVIGEFLTQDTSQPRTELPLALFIGMWVEVALFAYVLFSILRTLSNDAWHIQRITLVIKVLLLAILAWAWVTLVIDQWPCFFLGGNGC